MKKAFFFVLLTALSGCSSTSDTVYQPVCLSSEQQAREVGSDIFYDGFNSRVSYWVTGDPNTSITSLGLLYAGFDPTEYCENGGYPIIITFNPSKTNLDTDKVLKWSQIVLTTMLKERGIET
ncbi:hypothetical protein [Alteromonas flava]|uniref:hypothetical protein n=1 Tax=Alteromonas flava TaxID=2048003 RepID=UPI000C290E39|nr:hypothetical protein [Alteromonas flava]